MEEQFKKDLKEMMMVVYDIMDDEQFTEKLSNMLWRIYQNLKKVGFNDDQALQITINFAKTNNNK